MISESVQTFTFMFVVGLSCARARLGMGAVRPSVRPSVTSQ